MELPAELLHARVVNWAPVEPDPGQFKSLLGDRPLPDFYFTVLRRATSACAPGTDDPLCRLAVRERCLRGRGLLRLGLLLGLSFRIDLPDFDVRKRPHADLLRLIVPGDSRLPVGRNRDPLCRVVGRPL